MFFRSPSPFFCIVTCHTCSETKRYIYSTTQSLIYNTVLYNLKGKLQENNRSYNFSKQNFVLNLTKSDKLFLQTISKIIWTPRINIFKGEKRTFGKQFLLCPAKTNEFLILMFALLILCREIIDNDAFEKQVNNWSCKSKKHRCV